MESQDLSRADGAHSGARRTGALRSRTRAARSVNSNPYSRPAAANSSTSHRQHQLSIVSQANEATQAPETSTRTSEAPTASSTTPTRGLFSSLGRALTRPLSWLSSQGDGARSDPPARSSTLPSSSSLADSHSLSRRAQLREAHRAAARRDDVPQSSSSSPLRQITDRLTAGAIGRGSSGVDLERIAGTGDARAVQSIGHLPLSLPPPPPPVAYSTPTRQGPEEFGQSFRTMRSPSPAHSNASAAIEQAGRGRLGSTSGQFAQSRASFGPSSRASPFASPAYARGGSLASARPSASVAGPPSASSFQYSFGSERRLGGGLSHSSVYSSPLALGARAASPARSAYGLQSQSPFARNRSVLSQGPASVGGKRASSHFGASEAGASESGRGLAASRSGSVLGATSQFGGSRMSTASRSAKERPWSSLKLAPTSGELPSDGEVLARQYAALQFASANDDAARASASRAGSVAIGTRSRTLADGIFSPSKATPRPETSKRRAGTAELAIDDGASAASGSARKRRLVRDEELGMVWKDELDASRKPRTPPQNEAERVLNFLESMRVPQRESGKGIAEQESSVSMSTVKVPLPSSREEERRTSSRLRAQSPFTRSSRNQQYEANNEGLRSKLKRPPRQEKELGMSIGGAGDRSKGEPATRTRQAASASAVEDDGASGSEDETARRPTTRSKRQERESSFDDEVEEPPRRRNVIRTRAQKQQIAPDAMDEGAESSPRRLRSGRALPASAPAPRATPSPKKPAVELPPSAAASRTGSIGEVSRAHSKDTFKVLVDHPNGSRQKSSLRQRSDKQGPVTREPAARPRGTNRVAFVDSDDEESSAAEEAASQELKKVDLPKIAFPAGFKFTPTTSPSGTPPPASTPLAALPAPGDDANHEAAAASNVSTPSVSASNFEPHRSASVFEAAPPFSAAPGGGVKQPGGSTLGVGEKAGGVFSSAAQPSGDSLLSRIAPPPAQSEDESTTPRKPPPKIGFTLPETNHTASKTEAEVGGPPKPLFPSQPALASTAASPGFFSKPSNATPIEHRQDERNSGPPPNFFGAAGVSAPAKSNPSTNTIQPAGSVVPFSFAKPAPNAQEQPVTPTNTFSFGQLPAPAPKTGSFSFGPAPSLSKLGSEAEHTNSDGGANTAPVASPLTASGKLGESVGLGTPSQPFNGFGGLAKPTSSNKRAAEDENHEAQSSAKKGPSQPDLSGESSKPVSAAPFSSFGSGGAALPFGTAASSKAAASAGPTNLFTGFGQTPGKSGAAAPAGTSASTASSTFSFGAAPSTPAPEAAQPGFSFGAAASAAPSSTPSASTPSAISASNPPGQPAHATGLFGNAAPNPKPSQAPFKFGAPNTAQNGAVASSAAPSQPVAAASSNGGFGAPAINTSAGQSFGSASPASPGGFAFGSTSSNPPMTGLFGSNVNSGGFNAPAASASAGNAPAPFKFGTPANAGTGTGNGAFGGFGAGANAQANPTASSGGFGAFGSGSSNSIGFGANAQPSASDSRQESPFTFGQPSNAPGGGNSRQSSPFTFGVPQQGNAQQPSLGAFGSGASNNAGGGFTFSVPSPAGSRGASPAAAPANPFGQGQGQGQSQGQAGFGGGAASGGSPAPFVFGSSATNNTSQPAQPASPFQFGASPAGAAGNNGGLTTPTTPTGGGMFNLGAAPTTRQTKAMPKTRRRQA